jgi:hypothetical protein
MADNLCGVLSQQVSDRNTRVVANFSESLQELMPRRGMGIALKIASGKLTRRELTWNIQECGASPFCARGERSAPG